MKAALRDDLKDAVRILETLYQCDSDSFVIPGVV
jgi:hypothetical protein